MSFNISRKIRRLEMHNLIEEFKKESKLSGRQFNNGMAFHAKGKVKGLKNKFNIMMHILLSQKSESKEV